MTKPKFLSPLTNPLGLTNVGGFAAPSFADLDLDGDLDAMVGNSDGKLLYYENTGNATNPCFECPEINPFGLTCVGGYVTPTLADLDSDGDLDLVVGNYDGDTVYYENVGNAIVPSFAEPVINPFGLSNIGYGSNPSFADLDGDGDLDVIVGNGDGNIYYFENIGNAIEPVFAFSVENAFGLINVCGLATPTFADLDGDGDLDAIIGNVDGNTYYFENIGNAIEPIFTFPVENAFGLTNVGFFAKPAFADLNSDGDLDAIIGNFDGDLIYFENQPASPRSRNCVAAVTNPVELSNAG